MNPLLHQLEDELLASLHGLDSTHTQLHPHHHPTRWSIAQITQHLLLTYSNSASSIQARLAKGYPTRSRPTPSQLIARFFVCRLGTIPLRREAPPIVTPPTEPSTPSLSGDDLAHAVSVSLAELDPLLKQAEHLFDSQPCLSHFACGPLTASQWRRFHLVHGRHHIRQIAAIRREYDL